MKWKIYYDDGSTFSDEDGRVYDAPALGVQVIAQEDPDVGRQLFWEIDFYWYSEHGWFGGDVFGLWDYLATPGPKVVKFGRYVPRADFLRAYHKALKDPYLPAKTAWVANEVVPAGVDKALG